MKNNQNGEFEVKVEGELQTTVESQDQSSSNIQSPKSGGNAPSDLGAIKNNNIPNNGIAPSSSSTPETRSNLNRPNTLANQGMENPSQSGQTGGMGGSPNRQTNNGFKKNKQANDESKRGKQTQNTSRKNIETNQKNGKGNLADNNKLNSLLNQNRMKNFGKNKEAKAPKVNSSASFFDKAKGLFNGKAAMPKLPGVGGFSNSVTKKTKSSGGLEKIMGREAGLNFVTIFKALPIQVKIAIIGVGFGFFLFIIAIIIIIAARTSAADGNRELEVEYLKGNYTETELCEYLERNGYIDLEENQRCEDQPAYQFFVNFKEVMQEYETKYERNRFQVNVELLYETLAYYRADDEFYAEVTKEEIENLIDAMLEEIEESCVIKEYDEKTKKCASKTKYVYTLYEFSLNKYISYLKYGKTSTHPNYGNDTTNTSTNGKAVTRICGEGKNVDYVFGYGLVNTSSSPLSESSDCPNEPVTEEDYEKLPITRTTLEDLGAYGGVPPYDTVAPEEESGDNGTADRNTTKNVVISPSHQGGSSVYAGVRFLSEKESMYKLAPYLKKELESRGYNVFVVDENDGNSGLRDSHVQAGIDWLNGASGIYIALHSNAVGGSSGGLAWGPRLLYTHNNANSSEFADELCTTMVKLYKDEGRKTTGTCKTNITTNEINKFYSKGGNGAAALVEVGFHDNPDEALWITKSYAKIAKALADAIDNYRAG